MTVFFPVYHASPKKKQKNRHGNLVKQYDYATSYPITEALSMAVLLVVEDEKRIRQFVTLNLRARGHEIMEAESAEIGLSLLRERPADALLLDIKLPGMNGWEMLQAIQNDKTLPQIPVILMSASSFSDPSEYSSYPHIAARLVKPLGVPTLLQTVSQLLSTYKATS